MKQYLIHEFGEQFAREPVLRRMPDGSLICLVVSGGPKEPHPENYIMAMRSYDDGVTWTEPEIIFNHTQRGVWSTEMFTEGEAPMTVLYTHNAECCFRELSAFRSFTYDSGKTWTEPVSFPCGLTGACMRQGIVMSNGEWLFPVYWQQTNFDFDWNNDTSEQHPDVERHAFACGVAVSPDKGETWYRYGNLTSAYSLWEPNCIEAEPGHIIMFIRDNGKPYLSKAESFDYGKTWSEVTDAKIPNPSSKVSVIKHNDKVIMITNFTDKFRMGRIGRTNLEIRVSSDLCKTWDKIIPLTPPDELFYYPHAFLDNDKEILYVAYENGHGHFLAKIDYSELGI